MSVKCLLAEMYKLHDQVACPEGQAAPNVQPWNVGGAIRLYLFEAGRIGQGRTGFAISSISAFSLRACSRWRARWEWLLQWLGACDTKPRAVQLAQLS